MLKQQLKLNRLVRSAWPVVLSVAVAAFADAATARPTPDSPVQDFSGTSFSLNFGPWQPRATLVINSHDTAGGSFTGTLTHARTRFDVNGQIIAERSPLPYMTESPPPPSYRIRFSTGRSTYQGAIRIADSRARREIFMAGTFVSETLGPRGPFITSGPFPFCSIPLSGIVSPQTLPVPREVQLNGVHLDLNFGPGVQEVVLVIDDHHTASGRFTGTIWRDGDRSPVTGFISRGVEPASYKIAFDEGNRAKYEGAFRLNNGGEEAFIAGTYRINVSLRGSFLLSPSPFCGIGGRRP